MTVISAAYYILVSFTSNKGNYRNIKEINMLLVVEVVMEPLRIIRNSEEMLKKIFLVNI